MFLIALGVGLAVKSELGISPANSVPYVLSRILGLEQGLVTSCVFCGFILLQIVLLRREFDPFQLFQIVCATVFGYFVSLCNGLLAFPAPEYYPVRLLLTAASIVLISNGMFLYLCAGLIPQPAEGLCLSIQKRFGWKYSNIKVSCDCSCVCVAVVLSCVFTGGIIGLREGTVLTMLSVGKMVGFVSDRWKSRVAAFCCPKCS